VVAVVEKTVVVVPLVVTTTGEFVTVSVTVVVLPEESAVTVLTTVFVCANAPTDATSLIAYPEMNTRKRATTNTFLIANLRVLLEELNILYRFTDSS
jgi:hypothetical protein